MQRQQASWHLDQTVTQLPITYNWYDVANGGNPLLNYSSDSFRTPNLQANSNQSLYKYYYSMSNACGSTPRRSVNVIVTATGNALASLITADADPICQLTQGVVYLDNQYITPYTPGNTWFFNVYDSATGNNKLATLGIDYTFNSNTGSFDRNKPIFVTPNVLDSSRNYYVSIRNACGETQRVSVPITVDNNAPPKMYNISAQNICTAGTSQLHAESGGGDVVWYNSNRVGAVPIARGPDFTTPYLTTTGHYYVSTSNAKCPTTEKIPVDAPVYQLPTLTVDSTAYYSCNAGDEVDMKASADNALINWYNTASSDTPFWTGPTARVYPTTSTTYYVEAYNSCASARIPITVTVLDSLQITQIVPGSRVNSGTVVLGATANIGTPVWTATDGGILGYGDTYTTWSLSAPTTTYYVAATANGCTSERIPVIAKVNYVPIVNSTMNASRCGAGSVTLTASAEVGTIHWLDSNYYPVDTGKTFTTPSLNATATYYAQSWLLNANNQYVQSPSIPVKAYIHNIINPTINFSGACTGQQANVFVRSSQTSVKYSLRNGNTVVDSSFGTGNDITLVTPTLNSSTTFNVYAEKYDSSTALRFDGNNDYVEVLNNTGFNTRNYVTLAAWINRDDIQKDNYIISKGSFSGNNGYSLSILSDYKLTFDIGNQRYQTTATIPANMWTHVAASYDGNTVNLYINGTLSASFARVGVMQFNYGHLIIGSSQDYKGDSSYGFSGRIDEVAVFCGVPTETSIADMMSGKLTGNEYGLVAYYNFEHGAGITNVTDLASSGGANNGTLNNMDSIAAWVSGPPISYCNSQLSTYTLNPVSSPTVVLTSPASRVGPGSLSISAVPSSGATIQWFADKISTDPISTGNNLVIPIINYTTKYYASADNGCISARFPVVATVNDYPDSQQINCISSSTDVNFFDYINASNNAVVRVGQYLFTGDNNGTISVYNTGGSSLTFVSNILVSANNEIFHLEAANGYLYATVRGANNIYVIDYTDVSSLKLLGVSNSYYGSPSSFAVDNHYAYISSYSDQKLYIVNIGTPYNVLYLNSLDLGDAGYCVQKKDNIVYVGVNNAGIKLVNVSSPNTPYISNTISFTGSYNNFYVKGSYLYVSPAMTYNLTSYNTVLKVYDISDASNPVFVRDVSLPDGYGVSYTSDSKYLYVGTYSQTTGASKLDILDITTPSNPVLLLTQNNVSNAGVAVRLGHIYTIGTGITDYKVSTAPSIISTTPATRYGAGTVILNAAATSGSLSWYNVASGGTAIGTGTSFTTPSISATATYFVAATDGNCSSFRVPVVATVNELPLCISSSADLGSPVKLATLDAKATTRSGNYLYVTGGSLVYAYNISSGSPVQAGTIDLGGPAAIYELKVYGNYLFAVARYTEKIYIVDITNPASMQIVGSSGSIFNIPQGLLVDGSFAYVNNSENNSLDVINVSNPASPSRVAQLSGIGELSHGVQKMGNILYLSNYTYGFTVVDVSNPTSPTLVQQINSKESGDGTGAFNLYVIGNYLYVANDVNSSTPRIKVYDISNPPYPVYVNTIYPPNNVYSFNYDGYYLYCGLNKTSGNTNLAIYKMGSLTNPTLVATANSGRNAIIGSTVATISSGNGRFYAVGADFPGADIATYSVSNTATITSIAQNARCGTGSVNLQATANSGTITWYSDSSATTIVGTGASFSTPSLAANTTYYVNSVNNSCSLPTFPVLATVNPVPVVTGTTGASVQDTGAVILQATTNTGLLNWFDVASGGTPLGYGTSFTTPVINNTSTFYVESQGTLCTSTRVPVVATVITTPIIRTVTSGSHCLAGVDTLYATASIGTINWYDSSSSTTPIATGNRFITPVLSATRYYLVSTTYNGQTSPRVYVSANIGKLPPRANAGADITNLCGTSVNITADSINGGYGTWSILNGVATITDATNINTSVTGINGNVQLLWTVSRSFCPDNIDTLNIIAPKPKPIFYTAAYSCLSNSYRLVDYNANIDSITTVHELWGTPDIGNVYAPLTVAKNNKVYGVSESAGAANQGAIFELNPRTNTEKIVYNFDNNSNGNGSTPAETFLLETNPGVLFGIAVNGGANNRGVLYKLNYNTGQYTVIRHLSTSEGYNIPTAVLNGSKIYLLARSGGVNNSGAIFELDTATNALVVKYNFTGGYANNCNSFLIGSDGNLYGIIPNGTSDFGEIFQFNLTTNTFSIKYSFPADGSLGRYPSNMFAASNNKMYTITGSNGAYGNGTIVEYDPSTNTATKKFDFNSSANTGGGGSFMQASDGYLYAVSTSGGTYGNGALYRFNPSNGTTQIVRQLKCASTSGSLTGLPLAEYPTSNAYAGPDTTICGNTSTLVANAPVYGTGTWTVTQGSATFANANNANTSVTVNSDTTILRWTVTDNLCYTSFDEVQITRKSLPAITSAVLLNCGAVNGNYTFSAVANGSAINWYADTTGTIPLGTGNTFTIAANNASAMIYVSATANGCTSNRMPIVISVPSITGTASGVRCNAGSVQLQATANTGTINWYSTATGGTAIASGNSFTTPTITGTTVYYAEASQNGCVSARVADTATINSSTSLANAGPDQSTCSNTFMLAGNTPTQGTGIWTVVSGTATITNPASPTTTVTGVSGTATLRWSFNSSSCGISYDDVSLTSTITPLLWGVTGNRIYNFNTGTSTITSQNTSSGQYGNFTLFKASNGKMYGVSNGLFYEYVPSTGTVNGIHSFGSNPQGQYGMVELNGVLYGTKNYCLYTYNLNTNSYSQTANFPLGSGVSYGLTVVGNILYGITDTYIYTYDPSTGSFTVKYTFGSSDQGSALALGTNGKLYGTRANSGSSNRGMIYEYDYINNIYTLKYSFSGGSGEYPYVSKLCAASNSKIYGTCSQNGGTNGTFWEYDYINNSFNVKGYFNNNTTSGANPGLNGVIQASDGNIYGVTYQGGPLGTGVIYSYNPSVNSFNTLLTFPWSGENANSCTLIEYSTLTANAGPDQNICSSTATMAANTPIAGMGTWTVMAGTATITNANSPTTTVTGLKGTVILRWTVNYGSCSSAYDDVVINSIPAIATVTNASRCGTGAGTVTLNATATQGNINWYAAATGGTSLGSGSSFTTPSISSTTTYYVDATANGCTSTSRTPVVATIAPSAPASPTITASGSTNICSGTSVTLSAPSSLLPFSKFATSVIAYSTQYNNGSYAATQILGTPDFYPQYGDKGNVWSPSSSVSSREYIVLGFTNSQPINSISIYETNAPGGIDTVYVQNPNTGLFEIVYSGTASQAPAVSRINKISFTKTAYPVSVIRIAMNNGAFGGWKEIDAVSIDYNEYNFSWSPKGDTTKSINVSNPGNYSLTLVDKNGCATTSATTTVTLNANGIVANAGPDQVNCSGSFTMAANGTGTWSVVSGTATITTPSSPTTAVTVSSGAATLRWTINTSSCGITYDDVLLTKTSSPLMLLYTTQNEPEYPNYASLNLFDNISNSVVSKVQANNTGFSTINYLYKASDGLLYGIADQHSLIVYNSTTKKFDIIYTFSGYFLPNITEYNGDLVIALNNTMIAKYSLKSKSVYSITGQPNISWSQNPSGGLVTVGSKMYGMTSGGIYQYDPSNNTYTWKFDFNSATGNTGNGELVLGANGKLYAATNSGSNNNYGAFFEYDVTNNSVVQKAAFSTGSNGYNVPTTPILASNNNIYGTTRQGGANGFGTLWEYNTTNNTFNIKYNFTTTVGTATNRLMQGSDGYLYLITYASDTYGFGKVARFDIASNTLTVLKDYPASASVRPNLSGPMLEEKFTANAGADVYTVGTTGTLSTVNLLGNAATTKWTVVSGNATITNPDSASTTVSGLSGITTLRLTTNYGACSSSTDDVVYYAQPTVPIVTNGARCDSSAGSVTLGALSSSSTGVINWYANPTGGTSLGTGTSFTTPSISSTTTYYADVTDKYNSRNVTYSVSNIYDQCNFSNSALNDNNFTTGVSANGNPAWIKASFDSAYTVNSIYLAAGLFCDGYSAGGQQNYYGAPDIYYSNDNVNWTLATYSGGGMTDNSGKKQIYIGGITARYWRLQNHNNLSYGVAVTEFSFDFATNFSSTSSRVPVTAIIATTPSITNSSVSIGCSNDTLNATPSLGTINWYAAATGGTALGTGNSFITPTLNTNTTYYATAANNGCESSRQPVVASINTPILVPPANVSVNNTYGQCGATVTVPSPSFNNACGGATPTLTNNFNGTANASGTYPVGTTNVVWTATSSNGNTATCTQTVTITDMQSPNVKTQNRTIYLDSSGNATITANQLDNGSTDNCGISSYSASKTTFSGSDIGANQVILSVTDVNGNTAANAATVTVLDTIKPVLTAPASITVNCGSGQCGANVSFNSTASDNCSIASLAYSTASGSLFPVGTTIDTVIATDSSGNTSTATFTVTVVDNQAPVITCPANITVSCTASTDTAYAGSATATDNCQIQSITWADVSTKATDNTLSAYYNYTISRTWTATDIHGNSSNLTQFITVKDTTKPVIIASGSNLDLGCNPSPADIDAALGTATALDNCSILGTPTATDGPVISNGILRSQTRSFNIADVSGNVASTVNITVTWTVLAPASVSIASDANSVCAGTTVNFTATPTNGGSNPTYQWVKNGVNISGATSANYSYIPTNGDIVTCTLTATNACQTAVAVTSNSINLTVNAYVTPSIFAGITTGSQVVCDGGSLTIAAIPTNGGTAPSYIWYNGSNVISGQTTATYTYSPVAGTRDTITVKLVGINLACKTTDNVISNIVTPYITPYVTPSVSITSTQTGTVCSGKTVTFSAKPIKFGSAPQYQWFNGNTAVTGITAQSYYTYTPTAGNTDAISVVVSSANNACQTASTAQSNSITPIITQTLTPSVSIAPAQSGSVCNGSAITLNATPVNGGSSPAYQWYTGTTAITGATSNFYSYTPTMGNKDAINVKLTANNICQTATIAGSNSISPVVTAPVTPAVTIVSSQTGTVCSGKAVTFSATVSKFGSAPQYQWFNGSTAITAATTKSYYTYTPPVGNSDVISVVVSGANNACQTASSASSNGITPVITQSVTPSVSITSSQSGTLCSGSSVTFSAAASNGGSTPTYQWYTGTTAIAGATNATYSYIPALGNKDAVNVKLTANNTCQTATTVGSNSISPVVTAPVTPAVTIVSSQTGTVCSGKAVTFSATVSKFGSAPQYQWFNGSTAITAATTKSYYTYTPPVGNSDVISVVVTGANNACQTASSASSNGITPVITQSVTPSVSITSSQSGTLCSGSSVTFSAAASNGGSTPTYQWYTGTTAIAGATNATYSYIPALGNKDAVNVKLTANNTCQTATTVGSNSISPVVTAPVTPAVTITLSQTGTVCSGKTVTFSATLSKFGTAPQYQWFNGSTALTGVTTQSYYSYKPTVGNSDRISVIVSGANNTCQTTGIAQSNIITPVISLPATPTVSILANPGSNVATGTSVVFSVGSINGATVSKYQWYKGSTAISGATAATYSYTPANNDVISLKVTGSDSTCQVASTVTSNSITMKVTAPVYVISENRVATESTGIQASLYPNPSHGDATLKLTGVTKSVTITVRSILGNTLHTIVASKDGEVKLPAQSLASGLYIVSINDGITRKDIKWVKN